MTNETQTTNPDHDATATLPAHASGETQSPGHLLHRWARLIGSALKQAEQRIMENFKVPPSGG